MALTNEFGIFAILFFLISIGNQINGNLRTALFSLISGIIVFCAFSILFIFKLYKTKSFKEFI